MTIALPCCRGRWLGGSPPCSVYTAPCRPYSERKTCRSPSSHTPLSPTPATAARAPGSTAWGLQDRQAVSKAAGGRAPPLLRLAVSSLSPHLHLSPPSSEPLPQRESGPPDLRPRWSSQNTHLAPSHLVLPEPLSTLKSS